MMCCLCAVGLACAFGSQALVDEYVVPYSAA